MDALILQELHDELESLGFELADLGNGTFAVNSAPSWLQDADSARLIEGLLEDFKKEKTNSVAENRLKLSRIMARTASVRTGKQLQPEELQLIIDELFACEMPEIAPTAVRFLPYFQPGNLKN
jgi:DNA mismatch repair protein MutL